MFIYCITVFHSIGFLKKVIIHVLSEVMERKTVDSYCFIVISKCYDLHALFSSEYHQK